MELSLIIVGVVYIAYALFSYLADGVTLLGNLNSMNHKWLFSLWIALWAVPYGIVGVYQDSFLLILSAFLFFSLAIHPFISKNNNLLLYTGAAGGSLIALLSLGMDYNLWMGLPLLGIIYLILLFKQIEKASFYLAHFAFLILYVSLWMV